MATVRVSALVVTVVGVVVVVVGVVGCLLKSSAKSQ